MCEITPPVRLFFLQPGEICVNFIRVPPAIFKRPPPTPLQNFTVHRRFCPATISSFLGSEDSSSCSKRRCVVFVWNPFSCVQSLFINCNSKTKWHSCQPIYYLEFFNSLCGCLGVGCLRGRYRGAQACHKMASPKSNFLVMEEVEVMQWPAWSPDIDPTEHIWDQMGLFITHMDNPPTTVVRSWEALLQAWGVVNPERIEVLVWSMPRRLRVVMAARGGHTRY